MTKKFKIGDNVEFIGDHSDYIPKGAVGIVKCVDQTDELVPYFVKWANLHTGIDGSGAGNYVSDKQDMAWASDDNLELDKNKKKNN